MQQILLKLISYNNLYIIKNQISAKIFLENNFFFNIFMKELETSFAIYMGKSISEKF